MAIGLTVAVVRAPAGAAGVRPVGIRTLVRGVGASRGVMTALVMMVLVAIVSGTMDTLVPLRLGSDGYSAAAITVVLTAAGVLASAATYGTGRIFDRFGGIPIAITSIVGMAAFVAALAAARSGLQLAVVFVAATPADHRPVCGRVSAVRRGRRFGAGWRTPTCSGSSMWPGGPGF